MLLSLKRLPLSDSEGRQTKQITMTQAAEFEEYEEYILPSCPECGSGTEYVNDISRGNALIRCKACGWSRIARVTYLDDDWLSLGCYLAPGRIGDWIPYLPNDNRRKGLAAWQLPRPSITRQDWTLNRQQAYCRNVISMLADTLVPICIIMFDDEPYIARKLEKMESHISVLREILPRPAKISPVVQKELFYQEQLFQDLNAAFQPPEILNAEFKSGDEEKLKPYLWGWYAICYHCWHEMWQCNVNCAEVVKAQKVAKSWNSLQTSLEAFCSKLDSESLFYKLSRIAIDMRNKKYGLLARNKKQKAKKRK